MAFFFCRAGGAHHLGGSAARPCPHGEDGDAEDRRDDRPGAGRRAHRHLRGNVALVFPLHRGQGRGHPRREGPGAHAPLHPPGQGLLQPGPPPLRARPGGSHPRDQALQQQACDRPRARRRCRGPRQEAHGRRRRSGAQGHHLRGGHRSLDRLPGFNARSRSTSSSRCRPSRRPSRSRCAATLRGASPAASPSPPR